MALRRLNDISVDSEYLPKKSETQEHRTAIDYVLKVPDGKIVFWTGSFYICMTFIDFDVHVKNEQIERKIMKTKQHKHSAQALSTSIQKSRGSFLAGQRFCLPKGPK